MGTTVYALLVIYQKNGEQSAACESLRRAGNLNVLVVDNSEQDFDNEAYCRERGWQYLRMPGNSGLSKAYNAGIDRLRGVADYVILLDDDTTLGKAYIGALHYAVCISPETRIFLPTVRDRAGLLSPCRVPRFGVHRASDPNNIPQDEISGINSGMAIAMSIFDDYRYDERYFLDFIDHAFLREMRSRGEPIGLLDVELTQRFSGSDSGTRESALKRFKSYRKDCRIYYSNNWLGRLYYPLAITRRRLGLSRQLARAKRQKKNDR